MLALHLLQSALVHINTLLVERVLSEWAWLTASPTPTEPPQVPGASGCGQARAGAELPGGVSRVPGGTVRR